MPRFTIAVAVAACIAAPFSVANAAEFTRFGLLGASTFAGPAVGDISDDGSTLIGYGSAQIGTGVVAVRWSRSQPYEYLTPPPSGFTEFSVGYGISADGSVAVGQRRQSSSFLGFRYTTATGALPIDSERSVARAVSANGSIIVGARNDLPAYWSGASPAQIIPQLPGTAFGMASGISAAGAVIAGTMNAQSANNFTSFRAFTWSSVTGVAELPRLAGDAHSAAFRVSADGHVIVGASAPSLGNNPIINVNDLQLPRAVRWIDSGPATLIPLPLGALQATAADVSADGGVIVGNAYSTATPGGDYGVGIPWIWTPGGGTVRITDYLASLGVDLTGWQSFDAVNAISADGLNIAGSGTFRTGPNQTISVPWLLTIPSPSAAGLLGFAALAASARRRR